jgi:hypothetical protein
MRDYTGQISNTVVPSVYAVRLTLSGWAVLAVDDDPRQPAWRCVARLPLPRPTADAVRQPATRRRVLLLPA